MQPQDIAAISPFIIQAGRPLLVSSDISLDGQFPCGLSQVPRPQCAPANQDGYPEREQVTHEAIVEALKTCAHHLRRREKDGA